MKADLTNGWMGILAKSSVPAPEIRWSVANHAGCQFNLSTVCFPLTLTLKGPPVRLGLTWTEFGMPPCGLRNERGYGSYMFLHRERPAYSTPMHWRSLRCDVPSGLPVESGSLELRRFHRTVCMYEGKNKITWENTKHFAQVDTPCLK
jgi:hypothetical protein